MHYLERKHKCKNLTGPTTIVKVCQRTAWCKKEMAVEGIDGRTCVSIKKRI